MTNVTHFVTSLYLNHLVRYNKGWCHVHYRGCGLQVVSGRRWFSRSFHKPGKYEDYDRINVHDCSPSDWFQRQNIRYISCPDDAVQMQKREGKKTVTWTYLCESVNQNRAVKRDFFYYFFLPNSWVSSRAFTTIQE